MKKLLVAFVAMSLIFSVQASAKTRFGLTGGMNFNTSKIENVDIKAGAGWNAGITLFIDLPVGFSLQPSLVYNRTNMNMTQNVGDVTAVHSYKMGSVELPVSIQWGPDLLIFRPFLDVTPFVGYGITNEFKAGIAEALGGNFDPIKNEWEGLNRFQYGLSLGAGINVWKFQVIARYRWNMGSLESADLKDTVDKAARWDTNNGNFGGITLGLSFLF